MGVISVNNVIVKITDKIILKGINLFFCAK